MASLFTTNLSTTFSSTSNPNPNPKLSLNPKPSNLPFLKPLATSLAATSLLLSFPSLSLSSPSFNLYYGTAASAANYGGYGGNSSKQDSAEYTYEVPSDWKERLVSKIEKGTNGTDSEFFNPKKRSERVYLTYLASFRALAPMDTVLSNLALSDVELQDLISSADTVRAVEKKDGDGQVYYEYEIDGAAAHRLISVTCARNKLYAHFVAAPNTEWQRDKDMLTRIHDSFKTVT
ncbi:Mog1p/PsbP-like protein [Dioscorea alata]|uniref:Mog1p/PsbP-like protein n=1 Tax=Dioscorea alata TaxID=55571 RepID=A0ACB7VIR2_DIOAL|nr:Mog1p/PsbP-like protein [Dioscorea alata]